MSVSVSNVATITGMVITARTVYREQMYTVKRKFNWDDWEAIPDDNLAAIRDEVRVELEQFIAALPPLPRPELFSTWTHKNGNTYTVLHVTSEPDPEKSEKYPVTVIYEGPDGRTWPRTLVNFLANMTRKEPQ
jgi:hypothetical protein